MVFIYTPCRDTAEAKKIGKFMVEKKLAVCAHIFPIESIYPWEGKLEEGTEAVLLLKSTESRVQEIEETIKQIHSYSVPFIGVLDLKRVNREYKEWMSGILG